MREIKFRVWEPHFKTMFYQNEEELGSFFDHRVYPLQGKTIQQFTGLKDKNNKEIYEGDIVKFTVKTLDLAENSIIDQVAEVIWGGDIYSPTAGFSVFWKRKDSLACFCANCTNRSLGLGLFYMNLPDVIEIEVIGNTFENPVLCDS